MTTFKHSEVETALLKKGFVSRQGNHHYYFLYDENNKKTNIFTKTSHNGQDINEYLISRMSKQTHLSRKQFIDLIECPLSKEDYYLLLRKKNFI